jgi:hypothetical protein
MTIQLLNDRYQVIRTLGAVPTQSTSSLNTISPDATTAISTFYILRNKIFVIVPFFCN